jgi:hypothetical protein
VDDAPDRLRPQPLADRDRLRAAERAELKPRKVAIEHPVRVLDVRVPDEKDPSQEKKYRGPGR